MATKGNLFLGIFDRLKQNTNWRKRYSPVQKIPFINILIFIFQMVIIKTLKVKS